LEVCELEKARECLENLDKGLVVDHYDVTQLRKNLVLAYAQHELQPPLVIHDHLKKLMTALTQEDGNHTHVSQFLLHLESINKEYTIVAEMLLRD
jgi:hypothetical protein